MNIKVALVVGALALGTPFTMGCAAKSPYMTPAAQGSIEAAPEAATVVFIRPKYYASSVKVTIVDEKGRYLGESLPESNFAVKMPPGEHIIVGYTNTAHALKAKLIGGRVYYVHIVANEDNWAPRFSLLALGPRSKDYGHIDEWLAKTTSYTPDEKGGQDHLTTMNVEKLLAKGQLRWEQYAPNDVEERTIQPDDGKVGATPVGATAPASPPPPAPAAPQ